jgi:malonyl-CoA/methylmalonyl-CoA synthetase
VNLVQTLNETASRLPQKQVIIFESQPYTYDDIFTESGRVAALLDKLGVKSGDRVAIQLPKSLEMIFCFLANLSLGIVTLPLNTGYKSAEVEYFLKDSGCSLFITTRDNYSALEDMLLEIPDLACMLVDGGGGNTISFKDELQKIHKPLSLVFDAAEDDTALICYTSGTTGLPKGAMITHGNLVENTRAIAKAWQWTEDDILLHVLPLFHVHGLNVALLGGLHAGSQIIMHEKFEPEKAWLSIQESGCTMVMGVPTIYNRLLIQWENMAEKPDVGSVRVFISGSAPLAVKIFNRFEQAVGKRILERYGMTEAGMITTNPYEESQRIPGSVGRPFEGVEVRIADEAGQEMEPGKIGEIYVRGKNVFKGYWQNPAKTKETFFDNWLKSGDLGYQDPEDGMRIYIVGRGKELIITGGYNVYPKEIENVVDQYPGVHESAVFGLPDDDFGERVAAAVVLKDGDSLDQDQLIDFCKQHLANYKCPKAVFIREEIPRNTMGKVQKQVLQEDYATDSA